MNDAQSSISSTSHNNGADFGTSADANEKHPVTRYRPDIDGLRAVAVALVVGYHAFPRLVPGGFVGVDVFFVISGFLITSIIFGQLSVGRFSIVDFYGRRVRRIFPALILVILITFAIGWFVLSVKEFKSLGASMAGSATFVQNFVLLGEVNYFDIAAARKPLLHLWSLGIEEQYYIVWPAILILVARARLNPITAVCGLAIASYWFGTFMIKKDAELVFYLPFSRAWELFFGSGMAIASALAKPTPRIEKAKEVIETALQRILFNSGAPRRDNLIDLTISIAGVILISYVAARYNSSTQYPGRHALAPVAAAGLLIVSRRSWVNQVLLANRPMVYVGLISYPIYLWHFPLIVYSRMVWVDGVPHAIMAGIVLASVALAALTYHFVERPFRFGRARRYAIPTLVVGMIAIGTLGSLAYYSDGLPSRIPARLRRFMLTGDETSIHWRRGRCLLLPDQDASAFGPECAGQGGRPLLLLWGDSFAAAQYAGLAGLKGEMGYDVAEFTSSACPPIMGFVSLARRFCKGNNDYVLSRIEALRPDVVILNSTWQYNIPDIEPGLEKTIADLRSLSIKKVILLGPVPMWGGAGLSGNVIDYYYEHGLQLIPARTKYRLMEDGADEQLRAISEKLGIQYISAWHVMCDVDGCLARVGSDGADLTAFDTGHMTLAGSTFLARAILPTLLDGVK